MNVVIVGTGNVATVMGKSLVNADHKVVGVAGRNPLKVAGLAKLLGTNAYALTETFENCDVVLVAVSDDAIAEVAQQLRPGKYTVIHTSGTTAITALEPHESCAVLWPIQSITSTTESLQEVPLVIEANRKDALFQVAQLASLLSARVVEAGLEKRKLLHLAAVVMSNFPLHLMAEAGNLLERNELDPDLLLPLWNGMAARVSKAGNKAALTGPARRGDERTIKAHLDMLEGHDELKAIYASLSNSIRKKYHG